MARRPSIEIDGVVFKNVLEISYEIHTAIDETGRPSDKARAGLIKVLRESDDKTDIAKWAATSARTNRDWKSGNIIIRYFQDTSRKDIIFADAFISRYEERVPDIGRKSSQPPVEYFEISCGSLGFDGEYLINNQWTEDND